MHINQLFDLKGKTAIVTGGGRGLGEQIATALAEAGANIVLGSRKLEPCQEVSEKIKDIGVDSFACQCDVTNADDINNIVAKTKEHFGTIDILVNNSGATWGAPVVDMPADKWDKVMNVNARGTFLMSQAAGKVMIEQGGGRIINIASVAGLGGAFPESLDAIGYNSSKGAVITFTKDLAVKWARHNINVNAIAPGFFPTKMSKGVLEKGGDEILKGTPLNRFGSDHDMKGAALFLASDASSYVTGQVLAVDGGSSAT
ncbi:SDR family oxidoreductase [Tuberibacillus sp. Marseille-P3662]|uniref:SDR family oxidoreductase n=1 Tax=Tuberibacillus sp. Marseille-P3662 TaxID=1965358 RepID=UPI000A1C8578|nr:SDR family oxidoreductase [Tuberibacillus sp. Marseille-P3662]